MSDCQKVEPPEYDSDDDDGRLASLDALRIALNNAPFFKYLHNIQYEQSKDFYGLPDKCAIQVKNVTFAYKHTTILDQINIEVPRGRIYALLGMQITVISKVFSCILSSNQ